MHPLRSPDGGIGRRAGLKHQWGNPSRFEPGSGYKTSKARGCVNLAHPHFLYQLVAEDAFKSAFGNCFLFEDEILGGVKVPVSRICTVFSPFCERVSRFFIGSYDFVGLLNSLTNSLPLIGVLEGGRNFDGPWAVATISFLRGQATITNTLVKEGESVIAGQVVVILEAMKMQNNIEAEQSGTITAIHVNNGDTVMEGAALLTIE